MPSRSYPMRWAQTKQVQLTQCTLQENWYGPVK
uniref:Uncharacterized protein n=1 Tax=Arundo donax TaxID=35708 RepID=A0A0A9H0B3_ARUDO